MIKYNIEILPEATEDIENFMIFLKNQFVSKELILRLNNLIYSRIYSLKIFPEMFEKVYLDYRRILLKNYSIFYKVYKKDKKVIIYRILHQSQNFKNKLKKN